MPFALFVFFAAKVRALELLDRIPVELRQREA
jgi:hypothetical protein